MELRCPAGRASGRLQLSQSAEFLKFAHEFGQQARYPPVNPPQQQSPSPGWGGVSKIYAPSSEIYAQSNELYAQCSEIYAQSNELYAQCSEIYAQSSEIYAQNCTPWIPSPGPCSSELLGKCVDNIVYPGYIMLCAQSNVL